MKQKTITQMTCKTKAHVAEWVGKQTHTMLVAKNEKMILPVGVVVVGTAENESMKYM